MEDVFAESGVLLDRGEFFVRELAGLEQYGVRDTNLADVVQLGGLLEQVEDSFFKAEGCAGQPCVLADAEHVVAGVVIAKLGRSGEAMDDVTPGGFHLCRSPSDF